MELEITEWKDRALPVWNHCEYCHLEFIDFGCGICSDCYWDEFTSVQL